MGCPQCENGKYKWGKTGECKYEFQKACEKANKKNYNKTKPTPLGKTYEQYEKELKEFNLSKVERIELDMLQDLKKIVITAADFSSEAQRQYNTVVKAATEARSASKSGEKWLKKVIDEMAKIQRAAKELGVDVPNDIERLYKTALSSGETIREILKATSSIK